MVCPSCFLACHHVIFRILDGHVASMSFAEAVDSIVEADHSRCPCIHHGRDKLVNRIQKCDTTELIACLLWQEHKISFHHRLWDMSRCKNLLA